MMGLLKHILIGLIVSVSLLVATFAKAGELRTAYFKTMSQVQGFCSSSRISCKSVSQAESKVSVVYEDVYGSTPEPDEGEGRQF